MGDERNQSQMAITDEVKTYVLKPPYTFTLGTAHHRHAFDVTEKNGQIKSKMQCQDGDGNPVERCEAAKQIGRWHMRFDIYSDLKGEYRWRLVARNGKTIADSAEGYGSKAKCRAAVKRIQDKAMMAEVSDADSSIRQADQ